MCQTLPSNYREHPSKVNDDSIPSSPTPMLAGNPLTQPPETITVRTSPWATLVREAAESRRKSSVRRAPSGPRGTTRTGAAGTHTALSATYPGKNKDTQSPCKS